MACLYRALRADDAWSEADDNWSAKIIRTIDGGIICPNVPDAQIVPDANDGEYLFRIIAGNEIRPIATTVAPTMPVVAANSAPTNTTEMPKPPGTGPNNFAIVTSKSSAMRERCSIMPIKMKSGMAMSVSLSTSQ